MTRYIILHTDEHGEQHQLTGAWEATDPQAAIAQMLVEASDEDDGKWEARPVTDDSDIIE